MTEELVEQIKVVAKAREEAQLAKSIVKDAQAEWESLHHVILERATSFSERASSEETLLRELTLKAYAETGSKNPAVGVGIREVTKLTYDSTQAFSWATEHRMALSLDKKAFEKLALASPLDFVTITQEPTATIATNLEVVI